LKKTATILICFFCAQVHGQDSLLQKTRPVDSLRVKALDEVIVSASRVLEKLLLSPVSIEKLNGKSFAQAPAPSFFEALQTARGVQMITPSLGFRVMSTRGFANTTNVRFAQLTDGMDIQSPHIGAPAGNALGPTELDIKSAEIIPGSAAALYGMNAVNGMANFFSKDPFYTAGISIQQQTGINHVSDYNTPVKLFSETTIRMAHACSPKFAFKINGAYSRGYDWIADDRTDLNPGANSSTGLTGTGNPAYDGVNSYGNESSNRRTLSLQGKNYVVARTGYAEKEVTDYSLQNIKADAGLYCKPGKKTSFKYTYHVAAFSCSTMFCSSMAWSFHPPQLLPKHTSTGKTPAPPTTSVQWPKTLTGLIKQMTAGLLTFLQNSMMPSTRGSALLPHKARPAYLLMKAGRCPAPQYFLIR
jgi:TonB-dependent Receptor Plug Domain